MTPEQYKAIRCKLSLTQAELACILGVTRATINRRETGQVAITEEAAIALKSVAGGHRLR